VRRPWKKPVTVALALALTALAAACSNGTTVAEPGSRSGPSGSAPAPPLPAADATLARYAGYTSPVYADPAAWVCRPGSARDACAGAALDATAVAADGTLTPEPVPAPADPPVDCFYVYPTVSLDPGFRSDRAWSEAEEGAVAVAQVARLQGQCRVFAPVYRQVTVAAIQAIVTGHADQVDADLPDPFDDVLDAFRHYMANDNQGRPIVLVGHSQGGMALVKLLQREFDPHPDVRARLVAAYLPGSNLLVPDGADVGGDLATIPLCRRPDQTGCAVAWSSFAADRPPVPGSLFGRSLTPGRQVACVNPAAPAGGPAPLHAYFASGPTYLMATLADGDSARAWLDPAAGTVTTPFVTTPGLVTGTCASGDGAGYLAVTVHGDPADPRADSLVGSMGELWGLHLHDVDLVLGDMAALITTQSEAYRHSVG
jgi:hypothetical protein